MEPYEAGLFTRWNTMGQAAEIFGRLFIFYVRGADGVERKLGWWRAGA
jgi:hypothetical protein